MTQLRLTDTYVNRHNLLLPYVMNRDEGRGVQDALRMYSPYGAITKSAVFFGPFGSSQLHTGFCEYWDPDHVLRRLVGAASLDSGLTDSMFTGGKGELMYKMYLSSLGETIERVYATFYQWITDRTDELVVYGSYKMMREEGRNCLSPDEYRVYAPEQYEEEGFLCKPFTENTPLGWMEGKRLLTGESIWVPAQLVMIFYSLAPNEVQIGYSTSAGLSSHINYKESIYHGVTESFERDAVNLYWNCNTPPPRIEFDIEPPNHNLARFLKQAKDYPAGEPIYLWQNADITEFPVVTVIHISPGLARFAYTAGGGVGVDIEEAVLMAVNEWGQSEQNFRLATAMPDRKYIYGLQQVFELPPDAPLSEFDNFFKVVGYYGHKENLHRLDWYLSGPTVKFSELYEKYRRPARTTEERYDYMVEVLRKYNLNPIVFDFTPPQLSQIRLTKVYIPELTGPYIASKPCFGSPRYYEVPVKMGWSDRPLKYKEIRGLVDPLPYP